MRTVRAVLWGLVGGVISAAWLVAPGIAVAAPQPPPLVAPVPGAVVATFDPPEMRWGSGHRGVDLAASPGEVVVAAAAGQVSHVGVIAGVPTITVTHDSTTEMRTTYQPVSAVVDEGEWVDEGQPIGLVTLRLLPTVGSHHGLHWGLVRGDTYLDPLLWLDRLPIRLLPRDSAPRAVLLSEADGPGLPHAGRGSSRPADGPVTSSFGMRLHPVLRSWRLHDGIDIGAACGTPVRAVRSGVVTSVASHPAYGLRVMVDHTDGLRTGYAHLGAAGVSPGDPVSSGAVVGQVGTTGWSTGCHLHLMSWLNGRLADPRGLVS